ncbi:hypothetical protein Tco_0860756 [Tanacetum coccineum]|uniref:Uncharacterized protein n=1 Tax=Tanacetum coccineum TaxID=301880 RepID=A0ABQ5BHK7_9ASTR
MLCVRSVLTFAFVRGFQLVRKLNNGLDGGCDKSLRPADMLLYSWDGGLDVCVEFDWIFAFDANRDGRFRVRLCGGRCYIVEAIQKFSMAQDIEARVAVHILIGAVSLLLREWGPDSISASL